MYTVAVMMQAIGVKTLLAVSACLGIEALRLDLDALGLSMLIIVTLPAVGQINSSSIPLQNGEDISIAAIAYQIGICGSWGIQF